MQAAQKGRGERTEFMLPIDIEMDDETVAAGTKVNLFPDQIARIKKAAEEQKAAEKED